MKTGKAWITVAVMTGTLFTLSVLPAGAAGSGQAATAPGAHTVSFAVPMAPGNQASPDSATVGPHHKATVHPRVSCGDSSGRTAGFDGEVGWGGVGNEVIPAYIDVDGRLWSSCNGTAYVYVSYTNFGSSHNKLI